jgi:hypothetical protein
MALLWYILLLDLWGIYWRSGSGILSAFDVVSQSWASSPQAARSLARCSHYGVLLDRDSPFRDRINLLIMMNHPGGGLWITL